MKRLTNLICWLLILPISVFSQTRMLTGTITDSKGDPVPFATVAVKGTAASTTAGEDGNYNINVSGSNIVLIVSSAGFTSREINVGSASSFDIQLQESGALAEVVVTALG